MTALRSQQDAPEFEVMAVIDGPDPEAVEVMGRHESEDSRIRHIVLERSVGPGPARNQGWRRASGSVIAFVDDDCVPQADWLLRISGPILDDAADVVQGATEPLGPPLPRDRWTRRIVIDRPSGRFETCNIAYRTDLLERLGGFDEVLSRAGEDTDLGLRALTERARFTFCDTAVVCHEQITENFRGMLASHARAVDLPGLVKRHPTFRENLVADLFWDRRHAAVWAGLAGSALAATRLRTPWVALGVGCLALAAIGTRTRRYRDASIPHRVVLATGSRTGDIWEIFQTARGAIRARTLVL